MLFSNILPINLMSPLLMVLRITSVRGLWHIDSSTPGHMYIFHQPSLTVHSKAINVYKKTYTRMYIATLIPLVKDGKPPKCPSLDKRVK